MVKEDDKKMPLCKKMCLKPLTKENILHFYAPAQGVISYTALSVNVMNPSLIVRVFPKRDITNILLFNTLLGTGLYLYNKPHLSALSTKEKVIYSTFGAATFSLGSILVWAIIRSIIPENMALCTVCGVGSGMAFLKIARNYISHVDSLVVKK